MPISFESCIDKLNSFCLAQEKSLGFFGFFGFQGKKPVLSIINLLSDTQLSPLQRNHQAIKKISTLLADPQYSSDPKLKTLLNNVKEDLIRFLYNERIFIYKGDTESWANCQNINALHIGSTIKAGNYYCQRTLQQWLEFASYQQTPYQLNESDCGWKLHFSFDRETPGNFEKGINVVMKHLVEKNIPLFKIIPEDKPISPNTTGKDVTVYLSDNRPISEWEHLIQEIEHSLATEDVIPGKQANHTHMIQGGRFTSYRNDKDPQGNYTQQGFNPANEPDELENIRVPSLSSSVPTM
ncbi:hypothetical protein [Legionella sp. PC997]|uniref:hypothetical protein n=1 Tax=Legionella sp. PC997 TaxID=2755562 RepID=UPI0015F8C6F1|nr:hypothetical protein [Legionella sp. PC997]QMT61852.1 hypothetical protein HBNCFIEN_03259 [Legionella sp. PC997]